MNSGRIHAFLRHWKIGMVSDLHVTATNCGLSAQMNQANFYVESHENVKERYEYRRH